MNKNLRYYRISEPDLRELLMGAYTCEALNNGGVDNWAWCGESIRDYVDACSDIDGVHYEDLEEVVEASLCNYEQCVCKVQNDPLSIMLEGFEIE